MLDRIVRIAGAARARSDRRGIDARASAAARHAGADDASDVRALRDRIGRCEGHAPAFVAAARPRALALRSAVTCRGSPPPASAPRADFLAPVGARGRESPQYARRTRSRSPDADGRSRARCARASSNGRQCLCGLARRADARIRTKAAPADAIPCFRRAAREDPALAGAALPSGRSVVAAGPDDRRDCKLAHGRPGSIERFLPPRLALAEAAMTQGDFAGAQRGRARGGRAGAAGCACPRDLGRRQRRRRRSRCRLAAAALSCRRSGIGACPIACGGARCGPRRQRARRAAGGHRAARGNAAGGARRRAGGKRRGDSGSVAARRWALADVESLRRLAVVVQRRDPRIADQLAVAYSALCAVAAATAGSAAVAAAHSGPSAARRVDMPCARRRGVGCRAFRVGDDACRAAWRRAVVDRSVCRGCRVDPRRARGSRAMRRCLPSSSPTETGIAKALAARDCDVLDRRRRIDGGDREHPRRASGARELGACDGSAGSSGAAGRAHVRHGRCACVGAARVACGARHRGRVPAVRR